MNTIASQTEYVNENAYTYIDLQMAVTVVIVVTALAAVLPIALAIWGVFQKSRFLVWAGAAFLILFLVFGAVIAQSYANQGRANIGHMTITGVVETVNSKVSEISVVKLDTHDPNFIVVADVKDIAVGDSLELDCYTIDGAIALASACTVTLHNGEAPVE